MKQFRSVQIVNIHYLKSFIPTLNKLILIFFDSQNFIKFPLTYQKLLQLKQTMSNTQTHTEQLELNNLISISEIKLINNFSILNKKITKHDQILNQYEARMEINQSNTYHRINMVESNANQQIAFLKSQLNQVFNQLKSLQQKQSKHQQNLIKNQSSFQKINDELYNTQLQFQEKHQLQQNIFKEIKEKIQLIDKQIQLTNDEVSKKQNKVEVQKVVKDIEHLKQKDIHFEAEIKLNQHKIQKIQILNQKNQRLQAKKDIEFLKQIEDKVKRQVKVTLKGVTLPNGASILPAQENQSKTSLSTSQNPKNSISLNSADKENHLSSLEEERKSSIRKRIPISIQQDETLLAELLKSNLDNPLSKINQRINKLQVQQKDINEIIKTNKFKKDDKNDSSGNIKDKINELKPQVVKLWAKFDTLEDRLAFNQKKTDQKGKILNELISHQKENNWQKMDEKLKTLQTEIYTNIKDIKTKLEGKVNSADYDKFVLANEEKIKQINELIYLKSDKLQVKKALLFLESKIKEIILVISQDEENEKDALLTKKPIKCMSCDKQVDKFTGNTSGFKGNWDSLPYKDQAPETLGRFGMTNFGSLAKKLKKLEGKDLPILNNKRGNVGNSSLNPISP